VAQSASASRLGGGGGGGKQLLIKGTQFHDIFISSHVGAWRSLLAHPAWAGVEEEANNS